MKEVEQQRDCGDRGQDDEADVCEPGPCEQDIQQISKGRPVRLRIYRPVPAGQNWRRKHLATAVAGGGRGCHLSKGMANKHKQRWAKDPVTRSCSLLPSAGMPLEYASGEAKGEAAVPSSQGPAAISCRLTDLY